MKKKIVFSLAFLFMLFSASTLLAGYKLDPWGSKTWTGPGRPPHWSPQLKETTSPGKHDRRLRHSYKSDRRESFLKKKHNRRFHHRIRKPVYIYNQEPKGEKVIVVRERRIPVYLPVQPKPARLQCGGNTITNVDAKTGIMIIEYVTAARDC